MPKHKAAKNVAVPDKQSKKRKMKLEKKKEEEVQTLDDFLDEWQNEEVEENDDGGGDKDEEGSSGDNSDVEEGAGKSQKKFLESLPDKDPEFYKFLKENDQALLNFSDDDDDDDNGNGDDDVVHRPPNSLEVASDESDFEEDEETEKDDTKKTKKSGQQQRVTKSIIDAWETQLQDSPTVAVVSNLADALKSSLQSLAKKNPGDDGEETECRFSVEGGAMFNSVVRLCLTRMEPALRKVLKVQQQKSQGDGDDDQELKPSRLAASKKWRPLNRHLKSYTLDLARLLRAVSDESAICAILKHVHRMLPYYACLAKSAKHLLQCLVSLWSSADGEPVRVLAFLCIIRLTRALHATSFEPVVKQMYLAYVRNCRFTSPTTWPVITFMRRSLAEVFALDAKAAYTHAFVYIRQLSIALRNAITLQKKDAAQAVYNWQFVHSVHLWAELLGSTAAKSGGGGGNVKAERALEPLIYPLVQLIDGAVRLNYTSRYFPLRFHLAKILTKLSQDTGKFVPILPYYLDILHTYNFNKKTSKASMKPVDFSCILRVSKSQSLESGTKDTILDQTYAGMLEYLQGQSCKIAFPELVIPCVLQMREFLRRCKVANYGKKVRQLTGKIEENTKFVVTARKNVTFAVGDKEKVAAWERNLEVSSSPLSKFWQSWQKVREEEKRKVRQKSMDEEYDFIPKINKKGKKAKRDDDEDDDFQGLLGDDDSDDSMDDDARFASKNSKEKTKQNMKKEASKVVPKSQKKQAAPKEEEDTDESEEDDDEMDKVEPLTLDDMESEEEASEDEEEDAASGDEEEDETDEDEGDDQESDSD